MSERQNLSSLDTGMCSHGNLPNNCTACGEKKVNEGKEEINYEGSISDIKDDGLKEIRELKSNESVIIKDKIKAYMGGHENDAQKKAQFDAIINSGIDDCVERDIQFDSPGVDLGDLGDKDYHFRIEGDIKDGVELKLGVHLEDKSGKYPFKFNQYYRTGIKFNKDGVMRLEEKKVLTGHKPLIDEKQLEMIREFIEKDPIPGNKLTSRHREVIKIVTEKKEFEDLKTKVKDLSPEQLKELKEIIE